MGRSPCCEKVGLKKGPWTHEEDLKLLTYIDQHGDGSWRALPAKAGLQRCGKSCRLRWLNYLRPDIKRGKFSLQEEQIIVQLHALLGNKWSVIAAHLPKRTDNEIKNFWNTHVKKKLTKMGIDPVTHKPISVTPASDYPSSGLGQWETACQETEAMYLPHDSTLGQAGVAWPKAWNALPITSGDGLMWPNYNNGVIFTDHLRKSTERGKGEGSANLHFLVAMLLGYASMLLYRPKSGILTFFLGFGYLIGCHVYYMSGDAWKEGGIDATGALMVLTLKVISCSLNYNDGLLKDEDMRESQKKNRLDRLPSLVEYVGYCLCCGSHFAGPVFEMKDYLEWTEQKGLWSGRKPSPFGATIRAILQAAFCMALYLYLVPQFPLSRFNDPIYQDWGFWKRLSYQYMSGFTARWKYYFIWSISEASIIISGLGFSGWTESSPPKPRWDRAKNVDILGVELAASSVQLPLVWNIQVSTWLRHYVYDRLVPKGKKAGFFQLLATQTVSAVWHGLYPGYIIFFVQSALMIAGSRVLYRWQQAANMSLIKNLLVFINFAYTILVLNYSCVGFMVLSMQETIASYGSVYYVGTVLPISLILLSYIIKPARPARSKAQKSQ